MSTNHPKPTGKDRAARNDAAAGSKSAEFHHDAISAAKVFEIALDEVKPAKKNDLIYRPPDPTDPALIGMAREFIDPRIGQLTPVTLTLDNVIISGNRRYAAARLSGLRTIKAVRFPITSDDPRFEELLVHLTTSAKKVPTKSSDRKWFGSTRAMPIAGSFSTARSKRG